MRPSVVSDGDDADVDDELPGGATSLSAAFTALAGTGARRQVRLALVGTGTHRQVQLALAGTGTRRQVQLDLARTGARRQVRLAVPVGGSTALGGGGRAGVDDDERRGCRASLRERSLFIFSEENFIRKYAKIIIEWGYPLRRTPARNCSLRFAVDNVYSPYW